MSSLDPSPRTTRAGLSPLRRALAALLPAVLLVALLEIGARVFAPAPPPDEFSRGGQFREFLIQLNGIPQEQTDALLRYDPELFWTLRPDTPALQIQHARDLWPDVATNSLGMRDAPVTWEKPPGVRRILCLGDSCTYGTGVPREEGWTEVLEPLVGDAWEVINAGVPGYTSYQSVRALERDWLRLDPDIIVIVAGFNDRRSWDGRTDEEHASASMAWSGWLERNSRFVQLLTTAEGARQRPDVSAESRTTRRVPIDRYDFWMRRAAQLAEQADAHLLAVLWPVSRNLDPEDTLGLDAHQKTLTALGREGVLEVLNPIPVLSRQTEEVFLFDKVHMTKLGNSVVGRLVFGRLEKLGWL